MRHAAATPPQRKQFADTQRRAPQMRRATMRRRSMRRAVPRRCLSGVRRSVPRSERRRAEKAAAA